MKKIISLLCAVVLGAGAVSAQNFDIVGTGQGKDGAYLVKVTSIVKPADSKIGMDILKEYAIRGVIFRGFTGVGDAPSQKAIVSDPSVQTSKKEFFDNFFKSGTYRSYASIIDGTYSREKLKGGKWQIKAEYLVDKESLRKYLEQSGVVTGFSNLW